MSDTKTFFPKKRRAKPENGVLKTVVTVGIHEVTFETDFMQEKPGMQIFWIPGKPQSTELLPKYQKTFNRARAIHLQRVADIAQRPLTVKA